MTTFMSNPTDLDLHLEPLFDAVGDRQEPAPTPALGTVLTTVANPRRTTWTGYAKDAGDRLPSY